MQFIRLKTQTGDVIVNRDLIESFTEAKQEDVHGTRIAGTLVTMASKEKFLATQFLNEIVHDLRAPEVE